MQLGLGTRLPQFTAEEKDRIKGSYDFVGFNHYTSQYATVDKSSASNDNRVTFTRKCIPALVLINVDGSLTTKGEFPCWSLAYQLLV